MALISALSCFSSTALGDRVVPGLLFGGGLADPIEKPIEVDEALPRGPEIRFFDRPIAALSVCALASPVCVHSSTARDLSGVLQTLASAYTRVVHVLDLPPPASDGALGGGPELDWYLTPDVPALEIRMDSASLSHDTSSAFCASSESDVDLTTATRCVAGALSARLDAAETPALRQAYANHISWLVSDSDRLDAVDLVQREPHRALLHRDRSNRSAGAALWLSFVERSLGVAAPGVLPTALFSLSRGTTEPGSVDWHNEPDSLDVIRRAFKEDRQRYADFFGQFAASRAFIGDRNDGAHLPGLSWLGHAGRVRFDWQLRYSSLPRNLASPRALEPMAASYVWLELDSVPLGAQLAFRANWEGPVRFKWLVIAVDAEGREMSRWDIPFLERGTQVEKTLLNFEAAAGLIFVAMNLGGVDLLHPFDPDYEPWERHGYTLYITELE